MTDKIAAHHAKTSGVAPRRRSEAHKTAGTQGRPRGDGRGSTKTQSVRKGDREKAAKKRVLVVGSLNADLVVRVTHFPTPGETVPGTDFTIHPGGKGANQACAAARLGARVSMIGRVGADLNGRLLDSSLVAAGVDTSGVIEDAAAPTGTALITLDASGQNEIVIVPGANGRLSPDDVERSRPLFEDAELVLLQLEVPLETIETAARVARAAGALVILDPAPARIEALRLLPLCDYVTPNRTELALLAGHDAEANPGRSTLELSTELAVELLGRGAQHVIAKLGAEGALLVGAGTEHFWRGRRVQVVDTTAAGDVWNGAFAAALVAGANPEQAGHFANAAAALSVTRAGAQPSMPTGPEVEAFMRTPAPERRDPPKTPSRKRRSSAS